MSFIDKMLQYIVVECGSPSRDERCTECGRLMIKGIGQTWKVKPLMGATGSSEGIFCSRGCAEKYAQRKNADMGITNEQKESTASKSENKAEEIRAKLEREKYHDQKKEAKKARRKRFRLEHPKASKIINWGVVIFILFYIIWIYISQ